MFKKLIILLIAAVALGSCHKTQQKTPCGTQQCTLIFKSIGVLYTDNTGNPVSVGNLSVFNATSNKLLHPGAGYASTTKGFYIIADDNNKTDYSTDGDIIKVTATDTTTHQTKTVDFKISGGCNCHVEKLAGPDTIKFD